MPIAGFPYCQPDQCYQVLTMSLVLFGVGWIAVLGIIGFRGLRSQSPGRQHLLAIALTAAGVAIVWWALVASASN